MNLGMTMMAVGSEKCDGIAPTRAQGGIGRRLLYKLPAGVETLTFRPLAAKCCKIPIVHLACPSLDEHAFDADSLRSYQLSQCAMGQPRNRPIQCFPN